MATKFVSRSRIYRDGSKLSYIKNVKIGQLDFRGKFTHMDGKGVFPKVKDPGFTFDQVVSQSAPTISYEDVEEEKWVIELDGGARANCTGVDCLSSGEVTVDGEKESVITHTFSCSDITFE